MDLVVGEWGGALNYVENTGTSTAPVFEQRTGSENPFNGADVGDWSAPAFADIDGDSTLSLRPVIDKGTECFLSLAGDLDLVVGNEDGTLNYMENTGTSTAPAFVERTGSANPFDGVDVGDRPSAPALADLDGDGTFRPCPLIEQGQLNVSRRSQATWTS